MLVNNARVYARDAENDESRAEGMMLEGILCDRIYGCGKEICEVPKRKMERCPRVLCRRVMKEKGMSAFMWRILLSAKNTGEQDRDERW